MASNEDKQSSIEDFHLSIFSELHPLPGTLLPRSRFQKPDFIFVSNGRRFGLEHTELKKTMAVPGHVSIAELKGTQRGILQRAAAIADEMGLPPISLNAWFHDSYKKFPNRGESLARTLAEYVRDQMDFIQSNGTHGSVKIARVGDIDAIVMMTAISGKAFGSEGLQKHRWILQEPGFVRHDFAKELQSVIEKKNTNYESYTANCDECWLLIVVDRTKDDQRFELDEITRTTTYKSMFVKTFLMEITQRLLVELPTTQ
jgi:hypothetical protein